MLDIYTPIYYIEQGKTTREYNSRNDYNSPDHLSLLFLVVSNFVILFADGPKVVWKATRALIGLGLLWQIYSIFLDVLLNPIY